MMRSRSWMCLLILPAAIAVASIRSLAGEAQNPPGSYATIGPDHPMAFVNSALMYFGDIDTMAGRDRNKALARLMNDLRMNERDADAFMQYMNRAFVKISDAYRMYRDQTVCSKRIQLQQPEDLAAAMDVFYTQLNENRARVVEDSATVLNPAAKMRFNSFVSRRLQPGYVGIVRTRPESLDPGGRTPTKILEALCDEP